MRKTNSWGIAQSFLNHVHRFLWNPIRELVGWCLSTSSPARWPELPENVGTLEQLLETLNHSKRLVYFCSKAVVQIVHVYSSIAMWYMYQWKENHPNHLSEASFLCSLSNAVSWSFFATTVIMGRPNAKGVGGMGNLIESQGTDRITSHCWL